MSRPNPLLTFAHLTDTHVSDRPSAALLCRAVGHLNRLSPPLDFAIHTGDMVDDGEAEQFDLVAEALAGLRVPLKTCPGNHDLADMCVAAEYCKRWGELNYRFSAGGFECLVVNTNSDACGEEEWHGRMEKDALKEIRVLLQQIPPQAPLILFHHHGLVGTPEGLTRDVDNSDDLLRLLAGHRLVAAFGGHAHDNRLTWHRGVPFVLCANLSSTRANKDGLCPGFQLVRMDSEGLRLRWTPVPSEEDQP